MRIGAILTQCRTGHTTGQSCQPEVKPEESQKTINTKAMNKNIYKICMIDYVSYQLTSSR